MEPPLAHCTYTMVISPIREIMDGQYSADHYEFISWKPTTLKDAIDSSGPVLLIKYLGTVGFHHAAAATTVKHRHGVLTMCRAYK
jgi:hypothetical protein